MELLEQILYRYSPWWESKFILKGVKRREKIFTQLTKSLEIKEIVLLTGMRKIGKTTLMRMLIKHLLSEKKVSPKKILYISLDDYMFKDKSLYEIIDIYRALQMLSTKEEIIVFLDEVTFLKDYEIQLKNLHDLGSVKIYASSSSSIMLKQGQAYITGRTKIIEVPPLDFQEFLEFKGIEILHSDEHLKRKYFEYFVKFDLVRVLQNNIAYFLNLLS